MLLLLFSKNQSMPVELIIIICHTSKSIAYCRLQVICCVASQSTKKTREMSLRTKQKIKFSTNLNVLTCPSGIPLEKHIGLFEKAEDEASSGERSAKQMVVVESLNVEETVHMKASANARAVQRILVFVKSEENNENGDSVYEIINRSHVVGAKDIISSNDEQKEHVLQFSMLPAQFRERMESQQASNKSMDGKEIMEQRSGLIKAFASKNRKIALSKSRDGEISEEKTMSKSAIESKILKAQEDALKKAEEDASESAAKLLPAFNDKAVEPLEAYPVDGYFPVVGLALWGVLFENRESIDLENVDVWGEFVHKMAARELSQPNLYLAMYFGLLRKFLLHCQDDRLTVPDINNRIFPSKCKAFATFNQRAALAKDIATTFAVELTQQSKEPPAYRRDKMLTDALIIRMLLLALNLNDFKLSSGVFTALAGDLHLREEKLKVYFDLLGCKTSGGDGSRSVTLSLPLKFVDLSRKRMRR